jgi:hypothetical protein
MYAHSKTNTNHSVKAMYDICALSENIKLICIHELYKQILYCISHEASFILMILQMKTTKYIGPYSWAFQ